MYKRSASLAGSWPLITRETTATVLAPIATSNITAEDLIDTKMHSRLHGGPTGRRRKYTRGPKWIRRGIRTVGIRRAETETV